MATSERTDRLMADILGLLRELNYEVHRQEQIIEDLRAQVERRGDPVPKVAAELTVAAA